MNTAGKPAKIELEPDRTILNADGQAVIKVRITDKNETIVRMLIIW